MAHNVTSKDIPIHGEKIESKHLALPKFIALIVFIAGAIGSYFMFSNETYADGFAFSWVFAFMFFASLALGGCFWTLLHHVTNSGWGVSVRRLMENLGFVFPFFAIIALPLFCPQIQEPLYEWMTEHRDVMSREVKVAAAHPDYEAHTHQTVKPFSNYGDATAALHHEPAIAKAEGKDANHTSHLLYVKAWYMNIPAWTKRMVSYFLFLGLGIFFLRRISIAQDNDPKPGIKRLILTRKLSCLIMPIFGVTITFLTIDVIMGLDYKWFSTMYGVCFFAGAVLNGMAVLILTLTWLRSKGYLQVVTSEEHYHIMGKLMHAFVIFWAYVSFSQFMLIWYANITEETSYFLLRNSDEWWYWSQALVFGHFLVPFVLLLPHYVKKKLKFIVPVCLYLLVWHIIDIYIMVIPERGVSISHGKMLFVEHNAYLGDILAFITIGAFFIFLFLRNIGSANLYPNRDPRILESANLHN